jgi:hypothetical protein
MADTGTSDYYLNQTRRAQASGCVLSAQPASQQQIRPGAIARSVLARADDRRPPLLTGMATRFRWRDASRDIIITRTSHLLQHHRDDEIVSGKIAVAVVICHRL